MRNAAMITMLLLTLALFRLFDFVIREEGILCFLTLRYRFVGNAAVFGGNCEVKNRSVTQQINEPTTQTFNQSVGQSVAL